MTNDLACGVKNNALSWLMQVGFCFIFLFITGGMIVPFKPVPFIVYDLTILFICINYNAKISFPAILSYLSYRIFSGLSPLMVTWGYMLGMLVNSLWIDWLQIRIKDKKILYIIGTLTLLVFGTSWFTYFIGFSTALKSGFLPFLIPSSIKFALFILIQKFIIDNIDSKKIDA